VLEVEWQAQVVDLARLYGWEYFHVTNSRRSAPGWPDLALVRDRLVMAELKAEGGRLSKDQVRWIALLETAGVEVHVWRPSDLPAVTEVLRRRVPHSGTVRRGMRDAYATDTGGGTK